MFFSDFFRRLESDRRLFALPAVRRNRVYVCPRSDDAPVAPVKFPKPPGMKNKSGRVDGCEQLRNLWLYKLVLDTPNFYNAFNNYTTAIPSVP